MARFAPVARRRFAQTSHWLIVLAGIFISAPPTMAAARKLPSAAELQAMIVARTKLPVSATAVTISTKPTKHMSCSGGVCTPTGTKPILNVHDLTNMLAASGVTVNTSAAVPDIVVGTSFNWASANGLTLQAIGSVTINKPVQDAGPGALTLVTDEAGSGTGVLSFGPSGHVTFLGLSNPLTINGTAFTLVNSVHMLAQMIENNANGNYALAVSYNAKQDGKYSQSPIPVPFQGFFNGLGNTISHLVMEDENGGGAGVGLFQQTTSSAWIMSVRLALVKVDGSDTEMAGGLVADNQGTLYQDFSNANVTVNSPSFNCFGGGLAGYNEGTISFSNASGAVNGSCYEAWLGGLVGKNNGLIILSSATGNVQGDGWIGGLVGVNYNPSGWVTYSNASGSASATQPIDGNVGGAGGLVGASCGNITYSSATGASTTDDNGRAGGLVGATCLYGDNIDSSSATGAVSGGANTVVGGLIGIIVAGGSPASNSVSSGTVAAGSGSYIGGFVGYDDSGNGDTNGLTNDGWDMTKSGITDPSKGAGNIDNDPGITGFD